MARVLHIAFLVSFTAVVCQSLEAQSSQTQWWPEIDLYSTVNSRVRAFFQAKRETDGSVYDQATLGPMLLITLRPMLRPRLRSADITKQRYLTFGVGYQHLTGTTRTAENRGVIALTPRSSLPFSLLVSDRNRLDLRFISGNFSWRYRNRLTLERNFTIKRLSLTPYAQGEVFYDSRYDKWNKNTYAFGVTIPTGGHVELQPYYEHDNSTNSSPQHVNALGFTVYLYF